MSAPQTGIGPSSLLSPPVEESSTVLQPHLRAVTVLMWAPLALLATVVAIVVLWAIGLPFWLGFVVGPLLALGVVWLLVRRAMSRTLVAIGARPLGDDEHPRFENLVAGLLLSTGVAEPELHVIDSASLNAAALEWGGEQALVVTTGLLDACDRVELEASSPVCWFG